MASNIDLNNNYQMQNPQLRQRMQAEANFGAIDREKLKQDTAEFSEKTNQKVQENIDENGFVKASKKIIPDNAKKFLKSLGLVLLTTVGLAVLGNKSMVGMAKAGQSVDDFLTNKKWYNAISNFFGKQKTRLTTALSNNKGTLGDIYDTFKNRKATQKSDFTRGYGKGFLSIFSLTPPDILKKKLDKIPDIQSQIKALTPLLGEDGAQKIHGMLYGKNIENKKICDALTDIIDTRFGCNNSKTELLKVFEAMRNGEKMCDAAGNLVDFSEFMDIKMKDNAKGLKKLSPMRLIGDWWPANIIDTIGGKIGGNNWTKGAGHHFKGNLGDSLIKYNVVNGSMAKTGLGKFVQKSIIIPSESISNFGNDKSGLGALLCLGMMLPMFNSVQDAPKGQKAATVADDFVGTIGSIAVATPMAFATTYGLATLGNLKGEKLPAKILRGIGKFFNMGLDRYAKNGKDIIKGSENLIPRTAGGALRFILIMFVFSRMFSKPIYGLIHKIFGKPYDKAEAEQQKASEEQKNTIIPELGITQGEFLEKIQKNPKAIEQLQNNPQIIQKLEQNPKLLLDCLDGKDITEELNQIQIKQPDLSQANADLIKRKEQNRTNAVNPQNGQNSTNMTNNSLNKIKDNTSEKQEVPEDFDLASLDNVTYIPSSDFTASSNVYTETQTKEINDALSKADKALARAEKFLN